MKAKIIQERTLRRLYLDEGLSLRKIAAQLQRPLSTVNKYMKKYGIDRRSKSGAQSLFLENNDHPMQGKHHSQETKDQISGTLGAFWNDLDDAKREEYRERVGSGWKRKWAAMSDGEKTNMIAELNAAGRAKQGQGSRFERFVAAELNKRGYAVEIRTHNYMPSAKFEVDIALARQGVMIEVDGPTHFMDIYGEDALKRQQEKDAEKDEYLTQAGFGVLRVQDNNGPLSQVRIERITNKIEEMTEKGRGQVWYMS